MNCPPVLAEAPLQIAMEGVKGWGDFYVVLSLTELVDYYVPSHNRLCALSYVIRCFYFLPIRHGVNFKIWHKVGKVDGFTICFFVRKNVETESTVQPA